MTQPVELVQKINLIRQLIPDDGKFPNNGLLPLIIYQKALNVAQENPGQFLKEYFETNGWVNSWVDGIYDYHHYHTTAHEVLGVIHGSARVQFGGPNGPAFLLEAGDAVLIPAGVAHKAVDVYDDFACVGAYPEGQDYDIKTEKDNRDEAIENIKKVPAPLADPVYGVEGPMIQDWKAPEQKPDSVED